MSYAFYTLQKKMRPEDDWMPWQKVITEAWARDTFAMHVRGWPDDHWRIVDPTGAPMEGLTHQPTPEAGNPVPRASQELP